MSYVQLRLRLLVSQLLTCALASVLVPGSLYEEGCPYPLEAIWEQTCPKSTALAPASQMTGEAQFDLSGPTGGNFPPNVNVSASLYRFSGIDQKLFSFSATVKLTIFWLDTRATAQIANASAASKCTRYCTWQNNGRGRCCDGLWLPTLNFLNAETGKQSIEDYAIRTYLLPVQGTPGQVFVKYSLTVNAVFMQPFVFHAIRSAAFPFDRHALAVRIECIDCDMHKFQGYRGLTAYVGGWLEAHPGDDRAASGYSGYNTSVRGPLGGSMDGQGFPQSSGWQLNDVNLVMANFSARDMHDPPAASLAVGVPDFYGAVFLIYTQRVTRVYYVLQTIIPPILLVLLAFSAFIAPKDRFPDRLKTLAPIMVSIFIFQFTLVNILPSTYTLLAPHYLVFVSMVTVALLALIALGSYTLVNRQRAIEGRTKVRKGRDKWAKKAPKLLNHKKSIVHDPEAPAEPTPLPPRKSTIDPDLCMHCAQTAEEKQKDEEKKQKHEELVNGMARKHEKSLRGYRRMRMWWSLMALDGVQGYRDHIAQVFERSALCITFILYMASVVALFGNASRLGGDANQV